MSKGFRAAVGANLLGFFLEPLLEACLTKMLTAAIREMRFVQYLDADHTLVIIREILHEVTVRHFASRYHMIKGQVQQLQQYTPKCTGNSVAGFTHAQKCEM